MATVSELMREIYRLLKHRSDLREQITRLPQQRKVQQGKVARREQEQQEAQDALKKLKMSIHEKEVTLKTCAQQIKKYEGQLKEISSKKEYDALQHEIDANKKTVADLEDKILSGMQDIEEKTAGLPKFAEAVALARKEFSDFEATAQQRETNLRSMLADTDAKYKEIEAQVPPDFQVQFQRIVAKKDFDGLAPVRDHSCSSCSTRITIQNLHDMKQGQYLVCVACGRILFLPL